MTRPCSTLSEAWAIARPGDTISVANGDYTGGCSLSGDKSSVVTVVGQANARFICAVVLNGVSNLVLRGLTVEGFGADAASSNFSVRHVRITCEDSPPWHLYPPGNKCTARTSLVGAHDFAFTDVAIGPTYDSAACGGQQTNFWKGIYNATFTRVTFHDARYQDACANGGTDRQHTENVYWSMGGTTTPGNVTLEGCVFTNGPDSGKVVGTGAPDGSGPSTAALFLTAASSGPSPGPFNGLLMKNCVFYGPRTNIDGGVSAALTNSSFVNNTWTQGAIFQYPTFGADVRFINNVGASQLCPIGSALGSSGGYFNHNLWYYNKDSGSATRCGPTDLVASGPGVVDRIFANYNAADFRLKPGSLAVGRGNPKASPLRDLLGTCRFRGRIVDIGAYAMPFVAKSAKKAQHNKRSKAEKVGKKPAAMTTKTAVAPECRRP